MFDCALAVGLRRAKGSVPQRRQGMRSFCASSAGRFKIERDRGVDTFLEHLGTLTTGPGLPRNHTWGSPGDPDTQWQQKAAVK